MRKFLPLFLLPSALLAQSTPPPCGQYGHPLLINGFWYCIPNFQSGGGGSMTWPSSPGIAVYGGSNAWGTSLQNSTNGLYGLTFTSSIPTLTTLTSTAIGLANVTNNAQAFASIYPNTAPASGYFSVGNTGGTAYAAVAMSGDCTLIYTGAIVCTKSNGTAFGTAAFVSTGTSGATIPLLSAANTWSAEQILSNTAGITLLVGPAASGATSTITYVSSGGQYGNQTPGLNGNLKYRLYDTGSGNNGTASYGIGMSSGLMEFQSGAAFGFYSAGSLVGGIDVGGDYTAGASLIAGTNVRAGGTGSHQWAGRDLMTSPANGQFAVTNNAGTGVGIETTGSGDVTLCYNTTDFHFTYGTCVAGAAANIGAGTANQIPYQTGAGATGFIAAVNSAVVSTNGSGVPSESTAIPNGVTATTQTAGDNSLDLATDAFVATAILARWVSNVTGQSTSQTTVTLATSPTAGMYRINFYADQSATCSTGSNSVTFTFNWTDATNARTQTTQALSLASSQSTTTGELAGLLPIQVGSGNVTYTSTITGSCATGTSTYDIHAALERLQ